MDMKIKNQKLAQIVPLNYVKKYYYKSNNY